MVGWVLYMSSMNRSLLDVVSVPRFVANADGDAERHDAALHPLHQAQRHQGSFHVGRRSVTSCHCRLVGSGLLLPVFLHLFLVSAIVVVCHLRSGYVVRWINGWLAGRVEFGWVDGQVGYVDGWVG